MLPQVVVPGTTDLATPDGNPDNRIKTSAEFGGSDAEERFEHWAAVKEELDLSYARNPGKREERRANQRFPLQLAVSYRKLSARVSATPVAAGVGETISIGSKGLEFTLSEPLETGDLVRVSLEWPVRLDHRISLSLVVEGRILRVGSDRAVMSIGGYEFRTRAEHHAPASETETAEGKKYSCSEDKTSRLAC